MKQEKIWSYFQCEGVDSFSGSESRMRYLFNHITKIFRQTPIKILNIGIGNGSLEEMCKNQGWETYSLDPSEEPIQEISKKGVFGKIGYIQDIPFENDYFDVVVVSEVLEHLSDEDFIQGLTEVNRVLRKNGVLVGTVPYRENLSEGVTICPDCGKKFHRWGHMQSMDKNKTRNALSSHGFDVTHLSVKSFVNFSGLNFYSKLKLLLHWSLGTMGLAIASPTLFFSSNKKA